MKKRKTVKKRYVIAMVIVIAGLITLWRILNAPVPTYQTLIVRPGDLQQSVLATGKLDALRKENAELNRQVYELEEKARQKAARKAEKKQNKVEKKKEKKDEAV